jgi:hypothetical protein
MTNYLSHLKQFHYLDENKKKDIITFLKTGEGSLDWYGLLYKRELGEGYYQRRKDDTYCDTDPAKRSERFENAFTNLRNSITPKAQRKISEFNDDHFKDFLTKLTQHPHIESVKTTHELAKIVHEVLGLAEHLTIDIGNQELIQYRFTLSGIAIDTPLGADPYGHDVYSSTQGQVSPPLQFNGDPHSDLGEYPVAQPSGTALSTPREGQGRVGKLQ